MVLNHNQVAFATLMPTLILLSVITSGCGGGGSAYTSPADTVITPTPISSDWQSISTVGEPRDAVQSSDSSFVTGAVDARPVFFDLVGATRISDSGIMIDASTSTTGDYFSALLPMPGEPLPTTVSISSGTREVPVLGVWTSWGIAVSGTVTIIDMSDKCASGSYKITLIDETGSARQMSGSFRVPVAPGKIAALPSLPAVPHVDSGTNPDTPPPPPF